MRRNLLRILIGLGLLLAALAAGFVIWGSNPLPAMPEAQRALVSDVQVTIEEERWIVFQPAAQQPEAGLILYPGGRVDPHAYAPAARAIAENGYLVVIVPMPLNLAVFSADAAARVIAAYPQIQSWAVGGHSLGGAMAAAFASKHPDSIDGLVLWAAYPASSNDLSGSALQVTSISGELDGLAGADQIGASRALLPERTVWVEIAGGNHAQFGWYGSQPGDNPAAITRQEQQGQIVEATVALLESLP